jgi:3-hydroxybutyryl-CoA dehydrogenase
MSRVRVGVIGAGVMGAGVAQALAETGHEVVLVDVDEPTLAAARREIVQQTRAHRLLSGVDVDPEAVVAAIATTVDYDALCDVDFAIENATERWDVKREIYPRLDRVCAPDTVLIANTSAHRITRLAALTARPDRVLGAHFMNPVALKPAVELIPGYHTSDVTIARVGHLLEAMGKRAILVRDSPGFVSNRVLMLMVNEAAFLVYEGVATAAQADDVFRSCCGHPMGPLELADLIGLDTILYSVEVLHDSFSDSKYRPCPLLHELVDAGLHGRKTGRGFYSYTSPNGAVDEGGRLAHHD